MGLQLARGHADGAVHFGDQGMQIGEDGGGKLMLGVFIFFGDRLHVPGAAPVLIEGQNRGAVVGANDFAGTFGDNFERFIER